MTKATWSDVAAAMATYAEVRTSAIAEVKAIIAEYPSKKSGGRTSAQGQELSVRVGRAQGPAFAAQKALAALCSRGIEDSPEAREAEGSIESALDERTDSLGLV